MKLPKIRSLMQRRSQLKSMQVVTIFPTIIFLCWPGRSHQKKFLALIQISIYQALAATFLNIFLLMTYGHGLHHLNRPQFLQKTWTDVRHNGHLNLEKVFATIMASETPSAVYITLCNSVLRKKVYAQN